jgi:molybdopterin-containing oxidoreductase family iron-sulfur binding subunit
MVDIQTACQQACPTDAIVFGNANDSKSLISTTRADHAQRLFHVIEEVHTLPNINYLAKVRHTEEVYGAEEAGEEKTVAEKHS